MDLSKLPEDMLFEIKQYFVKCHTCRRIIDDSEIIDRCDVCAKSW